MPLSDGVELAGFTILRLLGAGGMGEVYLAQHPRLPRREAVKVLPADMSANAEFRARFTREADLAATLFHPHVVGVHDRGEFNGQLWISMDYIDGTDAGRLLRERYPTGLPRHLVVEIITAVADALDYAHENGLLHRDVKPANILLTDPDSDRRRILLADFGIARELTQHRGLTRTDVALGSVNYTAPEQLMGHAIDGRADQYGLAATAYHLLTGTALFDHPNAPVVISHHLNTPPPAVSAGRPELADLDAVLATALAKDPRGRYPRCRDFARALASPASHRTPRAQAPPPVLSPAPTPRMPPPTPPSPPPSPRSTAVLAHPVPVPPARPAAVARRTALSVFAVFALIAVAVIVVLAWPERSATTTPTSAPTTGSAPAQDELTFETMRDFVTGYYAKLPGDARDAWQQLSAPYQAKTGFTDYLNFWSTIRSVEVLAVSPRDATSVVARLRYVSADGRTSTENRWLSVTLDDGRPLIADSALA